MSQRIEVGGQLRTATLRIQGSERDRQEMGFFKVAINRPRKDFRMVPMIKSKPNRVWADELNQELIARTCATSA